MQFFKNELKKSKGAITIGFGLILIGSIIYFIMSKAGSFSCESAENICNLGVIFPMSFILVGGVCIICDLLIILVNFIEYLSNQKQSNNKN